MQKPRGKGEMWGREERGRCKSGATPPTADWRGVWCLSPAVNVWAYLSSPGEIGRHDLSVINDNQLRDHFSMKINDESSLAGQH